MKEFVFYTFEGYTESPTEQTVENLQILGFEKGNSIIKANKNLLKKRPWIIKSGFNNYEIIGRQLLDDRTKKLIKKIIDYNWNNEQKHYEENPTHDHIFLTLKELKNNIN